MMKEDKKLIDAIGSVLDRYDNPLPIPELVSMLNEGYLEYIGEDPIEDVTEYAVEQCVKKNSELFDNYFGVISLKNQKYKSIDEVEKELNKFIKKSSDRSILDFILCYLLFLRYDAVQNHIDVKKLSTGQLNFRTYGEPDRLDCSVITKLINQFSSLYGDDSFNEDFVFDNEDLINHKLYELAKIVRRIDWRESKLSSRLFDELIVRLHKLNKFNYRSNTIISNEFSEFIQSFYDGQITNKITEVHSYFADFIPFPLNDEIGKTEIELIAEEKISLIQSALRVLLKGYPNVRMKSNIISSMQHEDSDIVISFPPFGNLSKSFWADKFEEREVEISSLEELFTRDAIFRLNETGKAYLILPENFLSSNRKSVSKFREYLTNKRWIDSIVKLPQSWMFPHNVNSLNLVILNLKGADTAYFFDMPEYQRKNNSQETDIFNLVSELIKGREPVQRVSRSVDFSSILEMNCDLSIHKYINPIHYADDYKRSSSEEIVKLSDFTQRIRPERHDVTNKYPFINITELADDESSFVLDIKSAPKKRTYSSKRPLLKEEALLIGTMGKVLKPTIFQYKDTPIYLGSNVIALRVDKKTVDVEFLVSELNSKFVADQIKKLPNGRTIPNIKKSDILNIAIRIPKKEEQTVIFNEWISSIAKEKIKEIENLHESIKYIEKDVFSSFAHDFGKLQLKVSSSIDVIEAYLEKLAGKEIISLEESVFGEEDPDEGERVKDVIHRLRESHHRSVEFLKSEVRSLTQDLQVNKTIQLGELIEKWCISQNTDHFNFELTEGPYGNSSNELISSRTFENGYLIKGNEADIYKILDNMLDNAIKHGFGPSKRENKFRIHLENWMTDETNLVIVNMSVGNTGRPFPVDFSCEDFFKRRHRGPESKGEGLGGYSIKRAVDNLNAYIDCETKALSKKEYPVQFSIEFEPYNYDE